VQFWYVSLVNKCFLEQVFHFSKCKVFVGTIAPSHHHCEHMESLNKQGHSNCQPHVWFGSCKYTLIHRFYRCPITLIIIKWFYKLLKIWSDVVLTLANSQWQGDYVLNPNVFHTWKVHSQILHVLKFVIKVTKKISKTWTSCKQ
jgi:hypothetical protein